MKKVFFVTNELSGGGAERVISVLANYLSKCAYKVSIIALQGTAKMEYSIDKGIDIIEWTDHMSGDFRGQIRFIRSQMKQNPDATFISFFTHQNLYTILASMGLSNRVIVSERNDPHYSINGKVKKILRTLLYASRMCDSVVFQTQGAMDYFPKVIQKKGIIIANPLKEGLPRRFEGVRKKVIVSFGRLEAQKNYPMLIDAFARFQKCHPEYSLVLYGRGSQEADLKKKVLEMNLENNVEFAGFSKNVHDEIRDATVFVLPSNYEGLSNSMLEAMAIGLPVICTDCPPGGAREYIQDYSNGILVRVGDAEGVCKALNYIVENRRQAEMISKNAEKIRCLLSSDVISGKWEKLISKLSL